MASSRSTGWRDEDRNKPEWLQKLRSDYSVSLHPKYTQLQAWSRAAIAYQKLYDKTNKKTAEHFDVNLSRYERHKRSIAGKEWGEKIEKITEDPNEVTRLVLQSEGLGLALDQFVLYEGAKSKGDFATAHKIGKTLLDYADLGPKKIRDDQRMTPQIIINIAREDMLATPIVEAEYTLVSESTTTALLP